MARSGGWKIIRGKYEQGRKYNEKDDGGRGLPSTQGRYRKQNNWERDLMEEEILEGLCGGNESGKNILFKLYMRKKKRGVKKKREKERQRGVSPRGGGGGGDHSAWHRDHMCPWGGG